MALSPSLTVLLYFPLPRKKREKENRRRGGFLIGESEIGRLLDRTRAHLVQRFLPAFLPDKSADASINLWNTR